MNAQPLKLIGDDPIEPTRALIERLAGTVPITTLLAAWAARAGITDGQSGEVIVEIVFDTATGNVRRAIVHRKLGADALDHLGDSER